MILHLGRSNRIRVLEYDLSLPPSAAVEETFELEPGRNVIDLSAFSGIVSFELEKNDEKGRIKIDLR
jgi:hypothetical protein